MPPRMRYGLQGALVILFCLPCSTAFRQVTTATFYGIITDSSGALVPGAGVTLLNTVSAEQQQTQDSLTLTETPLARRDVSGILTLGTGVSAGGGNLRPNGVGEAPSTGREPVEVWKAAISRRSETPVVSRP